MADKPYAFGLFGVPVVYKKKNKHAPFPFFFWLFFRANSPRGAFLFRLVSGFYQNSLIFMDLKIIKYPNPTLRKKCEKVEEITPEIKKLGLDMIDIMLKNKGVGLAAPQVGELKRVIAVFTKKGPRIFINPKILKKSKKTEKMEEGCLCFPDLFFNIKRPKGVEFEALDEEGKKVTIKDEGFLARILQHEVDHLEGILFIDKIGFLRKLKLKKKLKSIAAN